MLTVCTNLLARLVPTVQSLGVQALPRLIQRVGLSRHLNQKVRTPATHYKPQILSLSP